jgi:hypothetical protein
MLPASGQPTLAAAIVLDGVVVDFRGAAEIGLLDVWVRLQRLGRAAHYDASLFYEVGRVGYIKGGDCVLLDKQDARSRLDVDPPDDVEDLVNEKGREAKRRFVQQDKLRFGHERTGDRKHLLQRICLSRNATAFLITHSIPEAVLLSDVVYIMSPRPGSFQEVVPIDLPRPRTLDMMTTPQFGDYVRYIRNRLDQGAVTA